MNKIIKLSLIVISVLSMNSSCNNSSTQKANVVQNADTVIKTAVSTVNTSSAQDFIEKYTRIRKEAYTSIEDYKISNEVIISNNDFSIINFTEKIQNYTYPYCIVLNPYEKIANPQAQSAYDDIAATLEKQNMKYNLYVGNMQQSIDFTNDGSPDFILKNETNFRTSMSSKSELLLFDGKSDIKTTGVIASSDFTSGECDFLIGVKEELFINEKEHNITIHREENISPSGGCNAEELIQLNYEKVWTFDKGKSEFTVKLNTPMLDTLKAFKNFPKKFTLIVKKGEKFVVPENCQNGGADTYEFLAYNTSEQTKIYILKEASDNPESYFVAGFKQPDQQSAIFYLRPRSSINHGDDFNAIEGAGELNTLKIIHDAENADRFWITYAKDSEPVPVTIEAGKYEFVKCGK